MVTYKCPMNYCAWEGDDPDEGEVCFGDIIELATLCPSCGAIVSEKIEE